MNQQITEQQAIEERQKYVTAFNDTMVKIWKEQITLLGVIDTGLLMGSFRRCRYRRLSLNMVFTRTMARVVRCLVAILVTLDVRRSVSAGAGSAVNTMLLS